MVFMDEFPNPRGTSSRRNPVPGRGTTSGRQVNSGIAMPARGPRSIFYSFRILFTGFEEAALYDCPVTAIIAIIHVDMPASRNTLSPMSA
jgi:hypothetical protein